MNRGGKMPNSIKSTNDNKMKFLNFGRVAILIIGFYLFKDLSKNSHFILAIVSSIIWFLSFYFYRKIPNKTGKSAALPASSILFGVTEIVIAVILKTNADLRTGIALWVIPTNVLGGTIGILSLYNALIFYFYPDSFLLTYPPPPPDPIAAFPNHIQDIINDGRRRTGNITLISMFVFVGAGIIAPFLLIETPNVNLSVMGIICVAGFITVPTLRHIAARKWQEDALESGIPKEILEEAAKLGNVPWPKTKEE
jgi:hypothetical protein